MGTVTNMDHIQTLLRQSKRNIAILAIWIVMASMALTFFWSFPLPIDQNAPMTKHEIKVDMDRNVEFFGRLLARSNVGVYTHKLYEYDGGYVVVVVEDGLIIGSFTKYAICETKECVIKELKYNDAAKDIYEQMNWNTNLII